MVARNNDGNGIRSRGHVAEVSKATVVNAEKLNRIPVLAFVGCSPDELVGNDEGFEMKCPKIVHGPHWPLSRYMWVVDFYRVDA